MRTIPLLLIASAFSRAPFAAELLMPSELDRFFYLVAINFRDPVLCGRIGPMARGRESGLAKRGYQVQNFQSACYQEMATLLRSPSLCGYVKPIKIDGLDGSKLDEAYCVSQVNGAPILASPDPFFMPAFVRVMQKLGYDDSRVAQFIHARSSYDNPTRSAYEKLRADADFLDRVRAARSYSEPRSEAKLRAGRPVEFLYQMVAIDNRDPALCGKVSPNATFARAGGRTALLRSHCYVALAYNLRNTALCDQLPRSGTFRFVNPSFDSLESCRSTVAIYRRPGFDDGGLHNGPASFPDYADFARALQEIGLSGAEAGGVATKPTEDDYWEFFSNLARWASAPDRAQFLQRVKTLR